MYAQSGQYDDDPGDSVILDTLEKLGLPRIWGLSSYVNSLGHRPVTNSEVAAIDAVYKPAMDQYIVLGVLGRAISIHVAVFPNQVSNKCPKKHLRSSPLPLDSQMMSTVGCANPT